MKIPFHGFIAATAFALAATSAHSQTLGSASNFDIFALNGGIVEMTSSNKLFGQIGFSNQVAVKAGSNTQTFQGTIFAHSGSTIDRPENLRPSGGIQTSPSIDGTLNQANADLASYASYLTGLTATQTFGNVTTNFSYTSTMAQTVLDFTTLNLNTESFTLNGRAGGTDQIIIRVSNAFEFDRSDLVLNNFNVDNVIWYYGGSTQFDLHRSVSDPTQFMQFAGTVVAPDGQVRLGEVSFTGKVFGSDLKMGSGFQFQGTVPEPSSSLMLLGGVGVLLLIRRRNH